MSAALDTVVTGGTVVLADGLRRADIGIHDGRIAAIEDSLAGQAETVIDACDLHVFPAAVDTHVHLNEPGRTSWEGFATGTSALAAGGATAFLDMPLNSHPPTTTVTAFELKRMAAEGSARVDFGLWGGIVPGNIGELEGLAAAGVFGFKAFMCDSGIADFEAADEDTLRAGMKCAANLGLPVAVHAESNSPTRELIGAARASGAAGAKAFLATRPLETELAAIELAISLAAETGCSLHVVHVSGGAGVRLVAEAQAGGIQVTCETCPHYLVLTEEDLERLGPVAKCAPPLRSPSIRESLWAAIADGMLPMVASDHSPCPPALKEGDVFEAWGGIAGAQTTLPILLSEGHHVRGLTLSEVAELVSGFPARRFAIAGKGAIEVGADADFALLALDEAYELESAELLTRHRLSPFIGRSMRGRIASTVLRGSVVHADGRPVGQPRGQMLARNS